MEKLDKSKKKKNNILNNPNDEAKQPKFLDREISRRQALTTVTKAGIGAGVALVVGLGAGYLAGKGTAPPPSPQVVTQMQTVMQTQTVTQSATQSSATVAPAAFPTTKEELSALFAKETAALNQKLLTAAQASSVNWKQFSSQVSSLNLSIREGPDNDAIAAMAKVFQQLSGITINIDLTPEAQQRQKSTVDILSKTGVYDIAFIDNMHLPLLVAAGGMEDLTKYINDSSLTDPGFFGTMDDFFPELLVSANAPPWGAKGAIYYIPGWHHHTMQYYRKDLFAKYGLTTNDIDTFDSLTKTAQTLNHPELGYYGYVSRGMRGEGINVFTFQAFFDAFGAKWFDSSWNPLVNSKEAVDALTLYVDLMTTYGPPGCVNWSFPDTLSALQAGKIALGLDCDCWSNLGWDPSAAVPNELGQMYAYRVPQGPNGRHAGFFSWAIGVPVGIKSDAAKKAAWQFIEFAYSPLGMATMLGTSLIDDFGRASVYQLPEVQAMIPPDDWLKYKLISIAQDAHAADRPMIPQWPDVGDAVAVAISSALAKQKSPQDALNLANTQIATIMKSSPYKPPGPYTG